MNDLANESLKGNNNELLMPNYTQQLNDFKTMTSTLENGEIRLTTIQAHIALLVQAILRDMKNSIDIRLDANLLVQSIKEHNLNDLFRNAVNEQNLQCHVLQIFLRYWSKIQAREKTDISNNDLFRQQMAYLGLEISQNDGKKKSQLVGSGWVLTSFVVITLVGIGAWLYTRNKSNK